jgi:hypothetical protein
VSIIEGLFGAMKTPSDANTVITVSISDAFSAVSYVCNTLSISACAEVTLAVSPADFMSVFI